MTEAQSMRNFKRTGGAGAGDVGTDGIKRNGAAVVGQSEDEAVGNTFGQLTKAEKKQWGVSDDEWVYGARDPKRWQSTEGVDRVRQLAREWGYAEPVTDEKGRPIMDGTDNIMVRLPLAPKLERDRLAQLELKRQQADLVETQRGDFPYLEETSSHFTDDPNSEVPFTLSDKAMLREITRQNRRNNYSSGIMGPGSPTGGRRMTLSQAESMYTPAEIEAEERMYAGTVTREAMTNERWAAIKKSMDPATAGQRRNMFSFSETGFVNNNSALAQARRNNPAAAKGR